MAKIKIIITKIIIKEASRPARNSPTQTTGPLLALGTEHPEGWPCAGHGGVQGE